MPTSNEWNERDQIIDELPSQKSAHTPDYQPGSGWFPVPGPNCWVCWIDTPNGRRLEIWPEWGGYLVVDVKHIEGDIAPFHG